MPRSSSSEKLTAFEKALRLREWLRRIAEQPRHFLRRFQMPLGIGFEPAARVLQRQMLADAGHDILQGAALGCVIEHVIDGDQRHKGACGDIAPGVDKRRASSPR